MICRMTIKLVTNDTLTMHCHGEKVQRGYFCVIYFYDVLWYGEVGCCIYWCSLLNHLTTLSVSRSIARIIWRGFQCSIEAGKSGELVPSHQQSLIILIFQNSHVEMYLSVPGISGNRFHNTHTHTHLQVLSHLYTYRP